MAPSQPVSPRPRIFLGSGAAGHVVAEMLRTQLHGIADVTTWFEGDRLTDALHDFDVAAFVLNDEPDRGVFVQLGAFLGTLGRERLVVLTAPGVAALPYPFQDLAVATNPAALADRVLRLTTPPGPTEAAGQVARRRRRSLGTACSDRPGQALRIADISMTGALLETYGEIPEHQLLDLDLNLENGRSLRVTARVVRIQYPQWGRVGGVGVAFTHFAGDAREVLEQFLDDVPVTPTA